jgi:hypothetical protein
LQKSLLQERRLAAIRAGGGAPTGLSQELTNGELQKHDEIFILPGKSWIETDFQGKFYATIGLTQETPV